MRLRHILLIAAALLLSGGAALADAPLKSSLGLSMDQAKQVDLIDMKYRKPFAAKRQEFNKEMRVLRRAKIANDSAGLAKQEQITDKLHNELREIRMKRDDEIRTVLTPEQRVKFEKVLQQEKEMVGSSRDVRAF